MLLSVLKNPQLANPRQSISYSDSCTEPKKQARYQGERHEVLTVG